MSLFRSRRLAAVSSSLHTIFMKTLNSEKTIIVTQQPINNPLAINSEFIGENVSSEHFFVQSEHQL